MKLLTPYEVAELTGLGYAKTLMLIKGMAYIRMDNRYYVSEETLRNFLTQNTAVTLLTTNIGGEDKL